MKKYLIIIRNLVWLICLLTFVWSCEQASKPAPKPKVIRKKIIAKRDNSPTTRKVKTKATPEPKPVINQQPVPATPKVQQPQEPSPKPKAKSPTRIAKKDESVTAEKPKAKPAIPPKSDLSAPPEPDISAPAQPAKERQKKPDVSDSKRVSKTPAKKLKKTTKEQKIKAPSKAPAPKPQVATRVPPRYKPKGKIDPFEPLFKEKKAFAKLKRQKRKKRVPRTPLERIELNQLKLVAIVLAQSGNRAMVEESSGKGYIIAKGTFIGTNAGKVIKIDRHKVIVAEEIEDVTGNLKIRNTELKLPKPPGEL
jgi:type IV pilus assembly protein PilP